MQHCLSPVNLSSPKRCILLLCQDIKREASFVNPAWENFLLETVGKVYSRMKGLRCLSGLAAVFLVALTFAAQAQTLEAPVPKIPLAVPSDGFKPLLSCRDPGLELRLLQEINKDERRRNLVVRGKLSAGIVDLSDPSQPRFASVRGDSMMYAASLPKIALLFAAYAALEEGKLGNSLALQDDLGAMIRVSSNVAATAVLDRLGFRAIEKALRDPSVRLYDPSQGGGIWIGKRYAKTGAIYRDPIANLSHGATADQVCRFYYLLLFGKLVSPVRSAQMMEHLVNPGLQSGFVVPLRARARRAKLYRKSGSWRRWYSDSVLVWGPKRRYILVALIEDEAGKRIRKAMVRVAERALEIN